MNRTVKICQTCGTRPQDTELFDSLVRGAVHSARMSIWFSSQSRFNLAIDDLKWSWRDAGAASAYVHRGNGTVRMLRRVALLERICAAASTRLQVALDRSVQS
jgi:hypothetical protein